MSAILLSKLKSREDALVGTMTGGIAALAVGVLLAGATAFGVVQTQASAGNEPVEAANVSYGNN